MLALAYNDNSFREKRKILIDSLRKREELHANVLDAMELIPREKFVSPAFINRAYEDSALPIEAGQTISQPYTVAYMTSRLEIKPNEKILEIGTGSGYQACLLALLGAEVYTIERIPELYHTTRQLFANLNIKINTKLGDGTLGWKDKAPYDSIIVTAAAPDISNALKEQLKIKGKMVIPIGGRDSQTMHIIRRLSEDKFYETKTDRFKFVPLIGEKGWQNA